MLYTNNATKPVTIPPTTAITGLTLNNSIYNHSIIFFNIIPKLNIVNISKIIATPGFTSLTLINSIYNHP
ncbi:hypothetical protein GCM10010217_73040 [Streptomyces tubercidicus]